jgi:hypothetical protein
VAEARLCLAQTKGGERCRRRVGSTATRCHLHCEAEQHSLDDEVVAARVVAPKAALGDTAVTTFAGSVQVSGLQDQARKALVRSFGSDTALTAFAHSFHRAAQVPGLQDQVRKTLFHGFGDSATLAVARSLQVPGLQDQVRKTLFHGFGDSATSAVARSLQVPGLQDQVRKTLLRSFGGDTALAAFAHSLHRAAPVPGLQATIKEALLESSQSVELGGTSEFADELAGHQTESGLLLPSPAETLIFGGKIDFDRAFLTFVLTGLLLPVIMSPALAPIRDYTDWCIFLSLVIYRLLGRLPKD